MVMTPHEIIAKAAAGDDWRDGEYRMGMGETRNADELNAGHRATADRILEALNSAGYRILGPGEWDKETVEKCVEEVELFAAIDPYVPPADAIRALAKENQG